MAKLSKERLDWWKLHGENFGDVAELIGHIAALEQEQERKWFWMRTPTDRFKAYRNVGDKTEVFGPEGWKPIGWVPNDYPTLAALTAAVEAAERGPVYGAVVIPSPDRWIPTRDGKPLRVGGWNDAGHEVMFSTKGSAIAFGKHYDELREKAGAK